MPIYHLSIKNVSRSSGSSAVGCSAYRSGEKLTDRETRIIHDFTRKGGVVHTEMILPQNAPKEYANRETLWNAVQKVEKSADARLAREFEVALPRELPTDKQREIVHNFAQSLADEGMCVDVGIHDKGDGNPHAHIMTTTRAIKENGEWAPKEKKVYALDENGEKIPVIDPKTGEQKIGAKGRKMWQRVTVQANDWNKTEKVEEWRERWADECNKYLEAEHKIDHRSYARQGIDQEPTIHEGYIARQIEKNGGISEKCEHNRAVKERNVIRRFLSTQIGMVEKKLKELTTEKIEKAREIIERYRENYGHRLEHTRADGRDIEGTGRDEQTVDEREDFSRTDGISAEETDSKRAEQEQFGERFGERNTETSERERSSSERQGEPGKEPGREMQRDSEFIQEMYYDGEELEL